MSPPTAPNAEMHRASRTREVRGLLWAILGLMILQGVLGIYLNLFVALPTPSDPNNVFPIIGSQPILAVHFANALVLVGLTVSLLVRAGGTGNPALRSWSGLLLLAFVAAAYSGYHFTGTQNNGYSFAMEMGFFGALVLVVVLLYRTGSLAAATRSETPSGASSSSKDPALTHEEQRMPLTS